MANFEFNYAFGERTQELSIKQNQEKKYLEWHDLIDIKVPLFTDPSILLGSRVPIPLHHRNPRSILTQLDEDWWNRTRQKVYTAQDRHCMCCGVHQSKQIGWVRNQLDAHEVYKIDWKTGKVELDCIVSLCKACHNFVHFGRLFAQHDAGKIQDKTFYSILSYGNTILEKAGLPKKNLDPTVDDNIYNIPWEQWRLVLTIEGKEQSFYSLYKDQADLEAHY